MNSTSTKSVRSAKSGKSTKFNGEPLPEFDEILYEACKKYMCPYTICVKKVFQQSNIKSMSVLSRAKKASILPTFVSPPDVDVKTEPSTTATSVTDTRCNIYGNMLHELNRIAGSSSLTEICLDGCNIIAENLCNLLDNPDSHIKNLSLSKCKLDDEMCKELATGLCVSTNAEKMLVVLNLSSNHITDEGAKHLGKALRTNRHLRYLNLADNRIGDDGAISIFNSLTEFSLTCEEIANKRMRLLDYLKAKQALFLKYSEEFESKDVGEVSDFSRLIALKRKKLSISSTKSTKTKHKEARKKLSLTDSMCDIIHEMIGPFMDPFSPNDIIIKEQHFHCFGNMVLCFINLSYNHLTYFSLKKLASVIKYQKTARKYNQQTGLIKISIKGNNLPVICNEYITINELALLAKGYFPLGSGRVETAVRKRSRGTASVSSNR